ARPNVLFPSVISPHFFLVELTLVRSIAATIRPVTIESIVFCVDCDLVRNSRHFSCTRFPLTTRNELGSEARLTPPAHLNRVTLARGPTKIGDVAFEPSSRTNAVQFSINRFQFRSFAYEISAN